MDTKIYSYRYMWVIKGETKKCFVKILTDTVQGLKDFENAVKKEYPDLASLGREYICEYDCSKLGVFEDLFCI